MYLSTIQLVSLAGSLIFLVIVLDAVRRQLLHEAYALLWLLTTLGMIILSIWTNILNTISNLIGIAYPPATLFLLLLIGIILTLFQYSIVISRQHGRLTRLTQELALLREKLERLENRDKKDAGKQ